MGGGQVSGLGFWSGVGVGLGLRSGVGVGFEVEFGMELRGVVGGWLETVAGRVSGWIDALELVVKV